MSRSIALSNNVKAVISSSGVLSFKVSAAKELCKDDITKIITTINGEDGKCLDIRSIDFTGMRFTDEAADMLLELVKITPDLEEISFEGTYISPDKLSLLVTHCHGLKTANLSYIGQGDYSKLFQAFAKHCPRLKSLDIHDSYLEDKDITAAKDMVLACKELTELDIGDSLVTAKGLCKFLTDTNQSQLSIVRYSGGNLSADEKQNIANANPFDIIKVIGVGQLPMPELQANQVSQLSSSKKHAAFQSSV